MTKPNLDEVVGEFKDGKLTREEYSTIMSQVRDKRDYLTPKEHDRLAELAEEQGIRVLTKYQFVQCYESAIFRATGVTRD